MTQQRRLLWQQIPAPIVTDILTNSDGFDGVVLDIEHGAFNAETMYACLSLGLAKKKEMFARFSYLDRHMIRVALDAGSTGIILSTVNSVEQAKDLIKYCVYPVDKGVRGLGLVRENGWGKSKMLMRKPILIAQIETEDAMNSVSWMVPYPIDYFLIGPYDLSSSLGCPGDFENDYFKERIHYFENTVPAERRGYHYVMPLPPGGVVPIDVGLVACSLDTNALVRDVMDWEKVLPKGYEA